MHSYPAEYEEWIVLRNGEKVFLRPVKPTDGPLILDIFSRLSRETVFFRFLTHLEKISPEMLVHLVRIDYGKDFALAAVLAGKEEKEEFVAVCRYFHHGPGRAELTIAVRDDCQGQGLGKAMVSRVVEIARKNGYTKMEIILD